MVSFKASAAPQVRLLNGIDRLTGRVHPPTLYTTPVQSISVYVDGVKRPLTRQLGTATQGVYIWDTTPPSGTGC